MNVSKEDVKHFKKLMSKVETQAQTIKRMVLKMSQNVTRNTPNVTTVYDIVKLCKIKINIAIDTPKSQFEETLYCVQQIQEQQALFIRTLTNQDMKNAKSGDVQFISPIAKLTVTYYHRVMALHLMYGYNITTEKDTAIYKYNLVKPEAERFWVESTAELNKFFIPLTDFMIQFKKTFPSSNYDENKLYKSVSLCFYENCISKYEFDFLTIICGQFHNIPSVIDFILTKPFFFPNFSFIQAQDLANSPETKQPGTFYFRYSLSKMKLVCCFITDTGICFQQQINRSIPKYLDEAFHSGKIKVPYGMEKPMDLQPLFKSFQAQIVDSGDGKYVAIGPENKQRVICQLCKVAKVKVRIEPCIHLVCNACYKLAKKFKQDYCGICGEKYSAITHIQMKYVEDPDEINYERVNDDNDVYGFIDSAQDVVDGHSVNDQDVHSRIVETRVLNRLAIVFNSNRHMDDKFDQMSTIGFTTLKTPQVQSGDDLYEGNMEKTDFSFDYGRLDNSTAYNPGSSGLLPNKIDGEDIYNVGLNNVFGGAQNSGYDEGIYGGVNPSMQAAGQDEGIYGPLPVEGGQDNVYGPLPVEGDQEDVYGPVELAHQITGDMYGILPPNDDTLNNEIAAGVSQVKIKLRNKQPVDGNEPIYKEALPVDGNEPIYNNALPVQENESIYNEAGQMGLYEAANGSFDPLSQNDGQYGSLYGILGNELPKSDSNIKKVPPRKKPVQR